MSPPIFRFSLLLLAWIGQSLLAKIIHVDDDASLGGDGSSWTTAHKYLQDALAVAESGDEIWVAEGTYKPDQGTGITKGDRSSSFVLVNGVGLYGGFLGRENTRNPKGDKNQTILSGEIDNNSQLWSLHVVIGAYLDNKTILNGFKITNGNANSDQGIRYNFGYDSNDHLEGTKGSGLYLLAGNMSLYNLTLANNNGDDIFRSRGLYSPENTSLVLDNCEFLKGGILDGSSLSLDQTNRVDGSTETIDSKSSEVSLNNCNFVNNKKNHGFLIENGNDEGNFTLELLNCKFSGNSKNGIHYEKTGEFVNDTIKLTNCEFLNNSGKGLYYHTPIQGKILPVLSLENCLFHNNSGGGIYFEREDYNYDDLSNLNDFAIALSNCQFVDNNASFGAGIYSNSHSMSVSNCLFEGNLAVGEYESTGGMGGAIYCNYQSTLEISDCNFSRNHADFSGGGIYSSTGNSVGFDTALILENSNFINNTSDDGGALHFYQPAAYHNEWNNLYSHTNIIKCNFYNNLATNHGGGIYCKYSNSMLIKQSIFQNNKSVSNGAGIHGEIDTTDHNSSLTLSECTFLGNDVTGDTDGGATGIGGYGGGLYFDASSETLFVSDIMNCIFFNNRSYYAGSAIMIDSDFSNLNFTNNTFVKNHNSGGMLTRGGAINLNGYERTSVSFVNCISWKNFQQGLSLLGEEKRNEWHGIVGAVMKKASGETNIFQGEFGDLDTNVNSFIDSSELMALNKSSMQLDPLFLNIDDPIGPDGIWFTADDGLRLKEGSPAIDSGTDIDASVQHDITGSLRRQGDAIDIGAYEYNGHGNGVSSSPNNSDKSSINNGNQSDKNDADLISSSILNSSNLGNEWFSSSWFGSFYDSASGWIYHNDLQWLYLHISEPGIWLWADRKGWSWTSQDVYPSIYCDNIGNWVYLNISAEEETKAYDYSTNSWTTWNDLSLVKQATAPPNNASSEEEAISDIFHSNTMSDKEKIDAIAKIILWGL